MMENRGQLPDGNKLLEADEIIKLKRCILGTKVSNAITLVSQILENSINSVQMTLGDSGLHCWRKIVEMKESCKIFFTITVKIPTR